MVREGGAGSSSEPHGKMLGDRTRFAETQAAETIAVLPALQEEAYAHMHELQW